MKYAKKTRKRGAFESGLALSLLFHKVVINIKRSEAKLSTKVFRVFIQFSKKLVDNVFEIFSTFEITS